MYVRYVQILFLAMSAFALHGLAQTLPMARPLPLHHALEEKNYFLLSLFKSDPVVRHALATDKTLEEVRSSRQHRLELALQTCHGEPQCVLQPLTWSDEEIEAVSNELARLYEEQPKIRKVLGERLQASGAYVFYRQGSGKELLLKAWALCAHGLNEAIAVYGEGARPLYPKIDSISFDTQSSEFREHVASIAKKGGDEAPNLFFEPSLKAALELLMLNRRDEAARFEPMETTANQAALRAISSTPWEKYAFSVIVVPGQGPEDPDVALAEVGRQRTALAADAYHAGKAPFILVSGGFVHPSQTRFSEAMEMKKALLRDYGVPEAAILVDPHARHTTTNMRNAAREIYRYGIPMNKTGLVVSDALQIRYIAGKTLADRCYTELGYVPYQILSQPSDTSLVFLPSIDALQQNPLDPLDP